MQVKLSLLLRYLYFQWSDGSLLQEVEAQEYNTLEKELHKRVEQSY